MRGGATKIAGCGLSQLADCATVRRVKHRHRLAIFFRVFKLAINRLHAAFQRGFELRQVADENNQFWICSVETV